MRDFIKPDHNDNMILDYINTFSKEDAASLINKHIQNIIDNSETQFNLLKQECQILEDNCIEDNL